MKHRFLNVVFSALAVLAMPLTAMAQEKEEINAHIAGYTGVEVKGGSLTLTWFLLIFLAFVCLGGLFKNAKRTHLD